MMATAALRRKLAGLEQRVRPLGAASLAVPDDPWRDPRLWDTALGVLGGVLAPGEFAAGLPEPMRAESVQRLRDVVEAGALVGDSDSIAIRRGSAWLVAAAPGLSVAERA